MFQNLKAKIHKAKENGLTTLLRYVTCPKSMNYEIILTIIVSNSLKFELVQFFLDQTLCTVIEKRIHIAVYTPLLVLIRGISFFWRVYDQYCIWGKRILIIRLFFSF